MPVKMGLPGKFEVANGARRDSVLEVRVALVVSEPEILPVERPCFRYAALSGTPAEVAGSGGGCDGPAGAASNGEILKTQLPPNCAWDIDFVVAY